jgi:oligoribonuclease NrnB/cAMP/cGMP phosphodiesterase (DHH superfamily)
LTNVNLKMIVKTILTDLKELRKVVNVLMREKKGIDSSLIDEYLMKIELSSVN